MVYQPYFLRERRYLESTPNTNLLSLPRKIRSLVYTYLFNGKVFSNNGREVFFSEKWHPRDEVGVTNLLPESLSILLVCRKLNTEATYELYYKSSCRFVLHVNAVKIFNGYHMPFLSQVGINRVQRLDIIIRLEIYGALHPALKEAWRLYLKTVSLEIPERCKIVLEAQGLVDLRLLKGLAPLLRTMRRSKRIEIMVLPDMGPCKDGSIHRLFCKGNVSVPKVWVDLMKELEGTLGIASFGKEGVWELVAFHPGKTDQVGRLEKAEPGDVHLQRILGLRGLITPHKQRPLIQIGDMKLTSAGSRYWVDSKPFFAQND